VVSDKTLDDVVNEFPDRALYLGGEDGSKPPRYRRIEVGDPALGEPFILAEIDFDTEGSGEARGLTWWPAGMVSEEIQRGVQLELPLIFKEVRMLMAINRIGRVLITIDPLIPWDPNWARLVET
jgi:hypothetical protein